MILCDREMQAALEAKAIYIFENPSLEMYDSTAVDLTLDKRILIWDPRGSLVGTVSVGRFRHQAVDAKLPAVP